MVECLAAPWVALLGSVSCATSRDTGPVHAQIDKNMYIYTLVYSMSFLVAAAPPQRWLCRLLH